MIDPKTLKYLEGYKDLCDNFRMARVFSFGGGVQSVAVMVLQAQGKLPRPYDYFLFCNVGDDSESPETLDYFRDYVTPFAEAHGIEIITLQKTTRGEPETLLEYIYRTEKSIPVPARMSNGAPGNRSCTEGFKISVVDKWFRDNDYTHGVTGLGISLDEYSRARFDGWHNKYGKKKIGYWRNREYPLIDLCMSRIDCIQLIQSVGLPKPPKSACWFCPFTSRDEWKERQKSSRMATLPTGEKFQIFEAAVQVENHLNETRESIGRDRVYLYPQTNGVMIPLANITSIQTDFFDALDDTCESGYCGV